MTVERIGKYRILSRIGQGAMGEVFKAQDEVLGRLVAVKTISTQAIADETLRRRFEREAQSAASLNHPNIVTVYDFGQHEGRLYMAMELLEGEDLKDVLAKRKLTGRDHALAVLEQIAEGLAAAHAQKIVHRDLKPANVHLLPGGAVKIMDFGLARLGGSDMTRTGMVMGTPHYMAPEQVRGERVDARSDVFSLGCVAYELLTGRRPFEAESMHAVLFKVLQDPPPPPRQFAPDLPLVLTQLLERALAKRRTQRFADAAAFVEALRQARQAIARGQGDQPLAELALPAADAEGGDASASAARTGASLAGASWSTPASPPRPERSRGLVWLLGGAALAVVAVAVVAWLLLRPAGPQPTPERSTQLDSLTRALVSNQLEIARRRLAAGDYAAAAEQAERALQLDEANAEARGLLDEARGRVAALDAAVARLQQSGSDDAGAEALWALMQVDPDHPLVLERTRAHQARFRERAEQARGRMARAQRAAQEAGAREAPDFRTASELAQQAERAFGGSSYADAARLALDAARHFEHASQSLRPVGR